MIAFSPLIEVTVEARTRRPDRLPLSASPRRPRTAEPAGRSPDTGNSPGRSRRGSPRGSARSRPAIASSGGYAEPFGDISNVNEKMW